MTLQEQHDAKRKEYMNGELTHAQFYLWLADAIHVTTADLPVNLDRIRQSKDEHLNDIALRYWDSRDSIVRGKAVKAGMRAWSYSDTVCVLKSFARREIATCPDCGHRAHPGVSCLDSDACGCGQ